MSHQAYIAVFAILFILEFLAFGMQRTTLLMSRELRVPRQMTALLLPKWFPLTWLVIFARWAVLIAIAFTWSWVIGVGLLVADTALGAVLPIPYRAYVPSFRKRIADYMSKDPEAGAALQALLDSSRISDSGTS